jgi:predicted RNase H-like HicB family nuclease
VCASWAWEVKLFTTQRKNLHRRDAEALRNEASLGMAAKGSRGQVTRFLITLEQTDTGFAVQAPDLAIVTYGENIEAAKRAVGEAIQCNLEAYREAGLPVPECRAFQPILIIPNSGICCSRMST